MYYIYEVEIVSQDGLKHTGFIVAQDESEAVNLMLCRLGLPKEDMSRGFVKPVNEEKLKVTDLYVGDLNRIIIGGLRNGMC